MNNTIRVTVTLTHTHTGSARLVVRARGRQVTLPYNHSAHNPWAVALEHVFPRGDYTRDRNRETNGRIMVFNIDRDYADAYGLL